MQSPKRTWLAYLPERLGMFSRVLPYAADVPDGFTRRLCLTFLIKDPGRGAKASPRTINVHVNPADARRMAYALLADADRAEATNAQHGDGGDYTDHWSDPLPPPAQPRPNPAQDDTDHTGHTLTAPRLGATGRHYYSSSHYEDVTVAEVTETEIIVQHLHGDDTVTIARTEHDLTALELDNPDDWETPT